MRNIEKNTVVVKKFGGTSLNDVTCLKHAASLVRDAQLRGETPVVVVSAMGGVTNQLVQWSELCDTSSGKNHQSERDTVITSGEQVTAGLMALALQHLGCHARSFLGWQLPILTNDQHTNADITSINVLPLQHYMAEGGIPVVAGFQGMTKSGRISSLGRGGSDTTAVALSALLNARLCQIFTDVDGVYDADPACVQKARKFDTISYEDMTIFSQYGAKVLHNKALNWASRNKVPIQVLSTFEPEKPGTFVCETVSGVARGVAHRGVLRWNVSGVSALEADHLLAILQQKHISVWGFQWSALSLTFFTELVDQEKVRKYMVPTHSSIPHMMCTIIGVPLDEVCETRQKNLRGMGVEYIFRSPNSVSYVVGEHATYQVLSELHNMVQEQ